jgi:hypothetical protein
MNPVIEAAQRRTAIAMIERQIERLGVSLKAGRITQIEHDARKSELETRKRGR